MPKGIPIKIEVGQKYGKWLVLGRYSDGRGWKCQCECGAVKPVRAVHLFTGASTSCHRCAHGYIDLTGRDFGSWKVIGWVRSNTKRNWLCECICGTKRRFKQQQLIGLDSMRCLRCRYEAEVTEGRPGRRLLPYESLFNRLLRGAAIRDKEVSITLRDYVAIAETEPPCHYCHVPLIWSKFNLQKGQNHNIDRKNNDLGYVPGNLVPCCGPCNKGKSNRYDYETWYGYTAYARERHARELRVCVHPIVSIDRVLIDGELVAFRPQLTAGTVVLQ